MNNTNAASAYRTAQFESAPPVKIVQMLYAGAIRFLKVARELDPSDPGFRENIHAAEEVVNELRASLDHAPNPELSANLENLYLFVVRELSRALLEREPDAIDASIRILSTLFEGWKDAGGQVARAQTGDAQQGNVA